MGLRTEKFHASSATILLLSLVLSKKKAADVYRWRKQRRYPTTVEKTEMEIRTLEEHILRLVQQHKLVERKGNGVNFSSLFSFWMLVVAA